MEPSSLPLEMFYKVMGYATDGGRDVKQLRNGCLVSRRWYIRLSDRICQRWSYDGRHHSISSLWKFLRSVLSSRRIAEQVQEVDIRNWTFGLVHDRGRLVLGDDDLDLIGGAIRAAGLEDIEASALQALGKADPRPLMMLLLASLPNLTTLYAQLPDTDIFFAELLRQAIHGWQDQQPPNGYPLNNLREVYLVSAWNYRAAGPRDDRFTLKLDHLWPVFILANIQKLSIFDLEPGGAYNYLENSPRSSSITELTLVHHCDAILAVPDTRALLSLSRALTSLSIYWDDCEIGREIEHLSNADLWNALQQHQDSLEHLDVYRGCKGCSIPEHSAHNSHFGLMRGFTRLQTLCIQPEVILGGCCGDAYAPFSLSDMLPTNLKSLTLYGDEGLYRNRTLSQQLQKLVVDTDTFPLLNHVALEAMPEHIHPAFIHQADHPPPHEQLERACRDSGRRRYETLDRSSCTKGGFEGPYYQEIIEERWEMGSRMYRVGKALTAHLSRLRREAKGIEEGSAADRDSRGLSLDDLDTFELPWDELCPEVKSISEFDRDFGRELFD